MLGKCINIRKPTFKKTDLNPYSHGVYIPAREAGNKQINKRICDISKGDEVLRRKLELQE